MFKRALLIGINYKNTENELKGCINDVNNIKNILIQNCGYNPTNIRILTEETMILPTKKNIETSIKWLIENCLSGDSLFFYYSGHGSQIKDYSSDEIDNLDEVLVPLDYKSQGIISDDWLFSNMVCKVPTNVTLWAFSDCCHSGTILDLKYNYKSLCTLKEGKISKGMPYISSNWTEKYSFYVEKSTDIQGNVCLFSGCIDSEKSSDATINNQSQGAFTFCFISFIKNNLIQMPDGSFRFRNDIKVRNILKEINCRLDIQGFQNQNSQLSLSTQSDFEKIFYP